jgi:dihydropyrimidinase
MVPFTKGGHTSIVRKRRVAILDLSRSWSMERRMRKRALVIGGGTVVTPSGAGIGDIYIEDGRISAVGPGPFPKDAEMVDARGRIILPGGVDPHVHLAMRSGPYTTSDDFESGSLAALRGGTTSFVDFVEPDKGEPLPAALDRRLSVAASSVLGSKLHMTISEWRSGTPAEMRVCVERGIAGFKIYLAYLETIGIDDATALRVLERARDLDARMLVHAESGIAVSDLRSAFASAGRLAVPYHARSRPAECEAAAIAKTVAFVRRLGGPRVAFAHVSSELGMREIIAAKREGLPVLAETCPHYLAFSSDRYEGDPREASRFVMSPPLRRPSDSEFLWACVADGSIDFISTDHCPFDLRLKEEAAGDFTRIPNGVGGIAERMAYVLTEGHYRRRIPLDRLARALSTNAGRFHGFPGHSIAPGEPANLCVWKIGDEYAYSGGKGGSRCDYSIYEGMRFAAHPEKVYVDGFLRAENWESK